MRSVLLDGNADYVDLKAASMATGYRRARELRTMVGRGRFKKAATATAVRALSADAKDVGSTRLLHAWPTQLDDWAELSGCPACGFAMLRLFVDSPKWVGRRVESIQFLDDRTVRRRVSVDYTSPQGAVALLHRGRGIRVLPLALMRKKSLITFDLRDEEDRPLSLLGLRETQALTLGVARAWAARALLVPALDNDTDTWLRTAITGDQGELADAYKAMWDASHGTPLARLARDAIFRTVLDRLADNFVLFCLDRGEVGDRHVVKFSYDEPLTLRYRRPGYRGYSEEFRRNPQPAKTFFDLQDVDRLEDEPIYRTDRGTVDREQEPASQKVPWWIPLGARFGLTPTLIRFPVQAAELSSSFHLEITAPPDVSIIESALLAGRPNRDPCHPTIRAPELEDECARHTATEGHNGLRRKRWRPSFDHVIVNGHSAVDLHVADVPYGSLARAQVALQASAKGWLAMVALSCWLVTAILAIAWRVQNPASQEAATLLITFTAAVVALLARADPHRMVTRLLSGVRNLAAVSSVLSFAAAIAFTFVQGNWQDRLLGVLTGLSLLPSVAVTISWLLTVRRTRRDQQMSPWEQHRPRRPAACEVLRKRPDIELSEKLEKDEFAYDLAVRELRFDRPAIRVASSEGARMDFLWTRQFEHEFTSRLKSGRALHRHYTT